MVILLQEVTTYLALDVAWLPRCGLILAVHTPIGGGSMRISSSLCWLLYSVFSGWHVMLHVMFMPIDVYVILLVKLF